MKSLEKLYRFHVANLRAVDSGLSRAALAARAGVSRNDETDEVTFTRLYALLLGAWAECRLSKLLYEPNAFTDSERSDVQTVRTHLDRWHKIVEIGFRKHYGIPKAELTASSLPHSAFSRYQSIRSLLNDELRFVITLRNKLAHGQWEYPLNESGDDVAQEQMAALRKENILSLQFKRSILDNLLNAVFDLALSQPTFERDFDLHFNGIEQARLKLKKRSYAKYAQSMRDKFQRGKDKRNAST